LNFEKKLLNIEIFNYKNRFIMYNTYYIYLSKIRLTIFQNINKQVKSVDSIYPNASWLEREVFEMYNIQFINKKDSRSLLLDYSRNEFPMLKDFPTEGFYEIYFDFFENKVNYIKNEFIEL
jgi:NADH:ubiquinone oxidoreductase subunit C